MILPRFRSGTQTRSEYKTKVVTSVGYGSRATDEPRRNRSLQEPTHTTQRIPRHEAIRGMSSGLLPGKRRINPNTRSNSEIASDVESVVENGMSKTLLEPRAMGRLNTSRSLMQRF
jgi:hypothetical protein